MHIFGGRKNEGRTIKNSPCQATGAEILRVACIHLIGNDIKIIALIHDAILINAKRKRQMKLL
jgi:DNA polymerase I